MPSCLSLMQRVRRNADGVAAVEFAMIAPIMFFLFVGSVEFSQAITVDRRVTQVASSTADLIAREKSTDETNVAGIMQIIDHLMQPYDPARLKVTVLNVGDNANNPGVNTQVCWSYNHNGGANTYANGALYDLPSGLVGASESVIIAEVTYDYQPLIFGYFIQTAFPLQEKFFLKPRLSNYVVYPGTVC
jgi:Flp pilus assembly protein TadG